MPKLILADGTAMACDWCWGDGGLLTANLPEESDFAALATVMNAPERTRHMSFQATSETTYCGYTRIKSMQRDGWPTGGILLMMEQGGE